METVHDVALETNRVALQTKDARTSAGLDLLSATIARDEYIKCNPNGRGDSTYMKLIDEIYAKRRNLLLLSIETTKAFTVAIEAHINDDSVSPELWQMMFEILNDNKNESEGIVELCEARDALPAPNSYV